MRIDGPTTVKLILKLKNGSHDENETHVFKTKNEADDDAIFILTDLALLGECATCTMFARV